MEFTEFDVNFSLQRKVALVTGAAKGIGKAIALLYAEKGADVILMDINDEVLNVEKDIQKLGRKTLVLKTDLTKRDKVTESVAHAVDMFGRLDILVNCAGVVFFDDTENLSDEYWNTVVPSRAPSPPPAAAVRPTCAQAAGGFAAAPSGARSAAPSTTRTADQDSVVDTSANPSATTAPPSRVQAAILLSLVPWAAEASSLAVEGAGIVAATVARHCPTTIWSALIPPPARTTSTALCLAVHAFVLTHHSTPRVLVAAVTFRVAIYPDWLVAGIVFCYVPVQPEGIGDGVSSAWSWAAMMSTARSPG